MDELYDQTTGASQYAIRLVRDLERLAADPEMNPSHDFDEASHSLLGYISRLEQMVVRQAGEDLAARNFRRVNDPRHPSHGDVLAVLMAAAERASVEDGFGWPGHYELLCDALGLNSTELAGQVKELNQNLNAPEEHGDAESAAKSQLQRNATDSDDLEGSSPPPVPCDHRTTQCLRCGERFGTLAGGSPVPSVATSSVDEEMRSADAACLKLSDRDRVIEYRRALRHALEEKWKWELYFDAADAVATKAVQRAEKAERERDQWYKLSGQPVQSLEAENTELREALREAVEWVESPGPGPPDLGPRRDRWNQIRLLTEEPEPMDRPVPSVDAEMARIWDDAKRGTQSRTEAADNYTKGLEDALRKALEEKQKWERYFDAADDVATKAVQRAEQAEREREQYIKGGWYEEYQKRLDALLAENTELREALRRLAPYSSEEPTR